MRTGDRLLAARYAAALREHWPYVLLTVVLAVVAAAAYVRLAQERFEATSAVLVPAWPDRLSGNERGQLAAAARLAESAGVSARVARRLDVPVSALRDSIMLETDEREVVSLTGIGGSPATAAAIADAYADALVAVYNRRSRNQSREGAFAGGAGSAKIVSAAIPPLSSVWPRTLATVLMAGIAGLLLGVGIAVAIERASPIVTDAESLAEHSRLRLLARLPLPTHKEVRQLLLGSYDARPELDEKARSLSAIVSGLLPSWSEPKTVLVLGAGDGHGCPAVAAALSGRLARSGMAVTLVDLDFERQRLAKIVQGAVSPAPSVGQILMARDSRPLLDAIQPVSHSHRLRMLVARDDRHLAGESVPLRRVPALSRDLKARANALVISAPSLPAAEMPALLDEADALIAVVAVGHTRREQVASLRRALFYTRVGYVAVEPQRGLARVLGAVSALFPSLNRGILGAVSDASAKSRVLFLFPDSGEIRYIRKPETR